MANIHLSNGIRKLKVVVEIFPPSNRYAVHHSYLTKADGETTESDSCRNEKPLVRGKPNVGGFRILRYFLPHSAAKQILEPKQNSLKRITVGAILYGFIYTWYLALQNASEGYGLFLCVLIEDSRNHEVDRNSYLSLPSKTQFVHSRYNAR
ncbi:hypothetical protein RE92_24700 (plasmid) [Paenibacillus polymyxa]|nr:hypothetical protein RE92_24700 [Paenibacillus polymyxa]